MVKDIQNLKVKLQMLGKDVLDTNSFALLTQEQSGGIRIYQILVDGTLNTFLSEFKFSSCELREHFILPMTSKPRQRVSLYTKYSQGDILGGLKVRNVSFGVDKELPVISVVLNSGVLICNEYGNIKIITLPEQLVENAYTYVVANQKISTYEFLLVKKANSGELITTPIARWSYDYTNYDDQIGKII